MKRKSALTLILLLATTFNLFSQNGNDSIVVWADKWSCEKISVTCVAQPNKIRDFYYWDFGDGFKIDSRNSNYAKHTYTKVGTYSITLISAVNGINDTIVKKDAVTIRKSPTANFIIDPPNVDLYAPLNASFIDNSIKGDGNSLTYKWNINNSEFSNDINPSFIFQNPNTYDISLNIEDEYGCTSYYSESLIIKDSAQINEFNYIINQCTSEGYPTNDSKKTFVINNNSLYIYGNTNLNCCTKHTATANINSDEVVYIKTYETGPLCTCMCNFDFQIIVPNIYNDTVNINFNGQTYTATSGGYVGINNIQDENTIAFYPNPAVDKLTVESINNTSSFSHIEIFNMFGELVLSKNTTLGSQTTIDLKNTTSGIYLIKIIEKDRCIYTSKFIIKK